MFRRFSVPGRPFFNSRLSPRRRGRNFRRMWNPFAKYLHGSTDDEEFRSQRAALLAQAPIPRLWLFGKTGSGKTSIVRYLTGATDAVIGTGFRPQTQSARLFSFPDDELPIVRFLDTRGLGEAN